MLPILIASCGNETSVPKEAHYRNCVELGKESKKANERAIFTEEVCRCMADNIYEKLTHEEILQVKQYRLEGKDERSLPQFNIMSNQLKTCFHDNN